ncbi:hypothetical protein [Roseateles flavus]|uniref:Peptidase C39-like domain-containing protein n=1 Tax=Roseateles flavus TaxID=3149041 RepID=A0ABV0GLA5_9BURK
MTITQVYVPNLRAEGQLQYESRSGKRRQWTPLHLQQSPLDGACGVHALLVAVSLTTGVPRAQLEKLSEVTRGQWHAFFQKAKRLYFDGASPRDLQGCAAELKNVRTRTYRPGSVQKAYRVCLDAIEAGGVPLLGLDGPSISHWSVAVGCEMRAGQPSALLCLDPSKCEPRGGFANAWLDLSKERQPAKGRKLYSYRDIAGGLKQAHITSVLVVNGLDAIDVQAS